MKESNQHFVLKLLTSVWFVACCFIASLAPNGDGAIGIGCLTVIFLFFGAWAIGSRRC